MGDFVSAFKPLYDDLLKGGSVANAVATAARFQEEHDLALPSVYVSTAITSGGYKRDTSLELPEIIKRNNRSAALIATALAANDAPHFAANNTMLPTELGPVKGWGDSDYILFYFCWLSGLSPAGAAWIEKRLAEPAYQPILAAANDRKKPNDERWPPYRLFVEIVLGNLPLAEAQPNGKRSDGCSLLLQLVDVGYSLGCQAEQIYADARGLDRLAPSFDAGLPDPLGAEVKALTALGATVGTERKPVELVPVQLRR